MAAKLKVVILSQYWSDEMAEIVGRKHYFRELSPWIQETINLFKGKDDVELHVVAPNFASNTEVSDFRDNIYYHYYKYSSKWLSELLVPLFRYVYNHVEPYKMAERLANMMTGYIVPANNGAKIIRKINPDLIHLFGSEVSDSGYPAIRLMKKYPMLLSVMGLACLQDKSKNPLERCFQLYREYCERRINNNVRFMTVVNPITTEQVKQNRFGFYSKCEKVYHCRVITKIPQVDALKMEKKYDVAFFARIHKDKGIEDLIECLDLLKQNGRVLQTVVMGRGNDRDIILLKEDIKKRGLDEQIDFVGFIENHDDVYEIAAQARLLVLPTHNDGLPNTVREAMFMRLPVVANNVGGIPIFNRNRHCVHLVELGDIEGLARGLCKVLDDDNYRMELIDNGYHEAYEFYSPNVVYKQMLFAYNDLASYIKERM